MWLQELVSWDDEARRREKEIMTDKDVFLTIFPSSFSGVSLCRWRLQKRRHDKQEVMWQQYRISWCLESLSIRLAHKKVVMCYVRRVSFETQELLGPFVLLYVNGLFFLHWTQTTQRTPDKLSPDNDHKWEKKGEDSKRWWSLQRREHHRGRR